MIVADLNKEGNFQVFKIPKEYQINDNKVYVKYVGNALYLIPFHNPWKSFIESMDKFTDDYMDKRQQPEQSRNFFD